MMSEWGLWLGDWGAGGMLIWTTAFALFVVLIVRWLGSADSHRTKADDAEGLLRHRFASGEIDREEYEQRLTVLKGRT